MKIEPAPEVKGEKPILCKKDFLAVLGTADTMVAAPFDDEKYEIWGVAQLQVYPGFKRGDILFELHTPDYWDDKNVLPRLNKWDGRLIMQEHYKKVPKSEPFPLETILQYRAYHRTSVTYILASAYHSYLSTGKPFHVGLFGVHMEHIQEEYGEQRPCCEYWLGRMEAVGMDTFISGGAILSAPFLYGYEKYNPLTFMLKHEIEELINGRKIREKEELTARLKKHEQLGAIWATEELLRKAQRGELSAEAIKKNMERKENG